MSKVEFLELRRMFQDATVWMDNYELFWYEHAWNVLGRQGATEYSDDRGYYEVWLRAVSLIRVYNEFNSMAFDALCNADYEDYIDGNVPMSAVWQIIGGMRKSEDLFDGTDEEGLVYLLDNIKYEVFKAIRAEMTESEVFVWMYCTGDSSYFETDDESKDDDSSDFEEDDEFDDDPSIKDLQDYERAVSDAAYFVLNDVTASKLAAFEYLRDLMD